ncbi:MAG: galactose ABC transporter substrate-binding protein [Oscillospiraceae bacterium]|jgi:methyl-galactoside transport system substrate-binding protein|nr:galactose ABC transporter substrate-binding protein [Oscillospiraceae bacterium]
MKKFLVLSLALLLVLSVAACGTPDQTTPTPPAADPTAPVAPVDPTAPAAPDDGPADVAANIGSCIYKFDDTFMTGVRNAMTETAAGLGAELDIQDSRNDQPTQNSQVEAFITKGVNALAINPVDRTAAGSITDLARAAGLPVVFLNREPEEPVMQGYDKIWYVGAKAEESGTMSGQILVDYWQANPSVDKNGDSKLQYVLLKGEQGHQDAELRTEFSQKALVDAGLAIDSDQNLDECLLAIDSATWDKPKATDLMNTWISSIGLDKIEAVFANNDDMALGALEALKANGYNTGDASKYIPVVGVDATAPALESMSKGELLGTVLNDAVNQGAATVAIANAAAKGLEINQANIGYEVTDGKYIWIPYVKVTVDNYTQFQ